MRRLPAIILLALPLPLAAQVATRFKLSESVPSTVSATDGSAITMRETISFVTVGMRDSAGVSIWDMVVDSTSSLIVSGNGVNASRQVAQLGPVWLRRPTRYRAYLQNGRLLSTEMDGQMTAEPFNARNPQLSLLEQLQPLSELPRTPLPERVGQERSDTNTQRRRVATGFVDDTTVVHWTRRAAEQITGSITHHGTIKTSRVTQTVGAGTVRIVLDTNETIVEMRTTMEPRRTIGQRFAAFHLKRR